MSNAKPPGKPLMKLNSPAAVATTPATALTTSAASISPHVSSFLQHHALPTEDILMPTEERSIVIEQFGSAIALLQEDERKQAYYLSKYAVAISIGLFDAALNYLWDETILALRRIVETVDLHYFFDVAEKNQSRRKALSDASDLARIDDAALIEACKRMGILTPVNAQRLLHINFMRNHASAAHPNDAELGGAEMIGWLSNCIKYAITAKADPAVMKVHEVLVTVRDRTVEPSALPLIESELRRLDRTRADDLLWSLFGTYCDPNVKADAKKNIELLAPVLWPLTGEQVKHNIGIRHGAYSRVPDPVKRDAALVFLRAVGGEGYRVDEIIALELAEKLRSLRTAHYSFNNFYNEAPHAAALEESLPSTGIVPKAVLHEWVFVICICYAGNGCGWREGVDEGAEPYYAKHIAKFGDREIVEFLRAMTESAFTSDFHASKPERRLGQLVKDLRAAAQDTYVKQALDMLLAKPKAMPAVAGTQPYIALLSKLPAFST